jgi:diacylglycerol kinase (ATP)
VRRVTIIHNPFAGGSRRQRLFAATLRLLEARCAVTLLDTSIEGEAAHLATPIRSSTCDAIVVAGGDGTINEVVNGLGSDAPPLGVIPLGTANVFARELGLPRTPAGIAQVIAEAVPRAVHSGVVNGRRFVQMAGIGFDAAVVAAVDPRFKARFGRAAYGAEILRQWATYRPGPYIVSCGGIKLEASSVIVAKGRHYAGQFVLDPLADALLPSLRVCCFLRWDRSLFLRYMLAVANGGLARCKDVYIIDATEVLIEGIAGERIQVDGDIRADLPCRIGLAPHPIRVLAGCEFGDR